jgi:hypothetical protein
MNSKSIVVLLGLYAATVAALISIHVYTPLAPSTAIIALFGLYSVTTIAYLITRPKPAPTVNTIAERALVLAALFLGAILALPLLLIGLIVAILALILLLPTILVLLLVISIV